MMVFFDRLHFTYRLGLILALFIVSPFCRSATYVAVSTAELRQQLSTFDQQSEIELKNFVGTGPKVEFGYFLTNSMAMELGYTQIKFEEFEGSLVSPSGSDYVLKPKTDIISYGLRWYVWEWLNFKVGGSRSTYDPQLELNPSLAGFGSTTVEETGSYYGIGLGLTFKKIQLFLDITYFPKADNENPMMSDFGLRVFF